MAVVPAEEHVILMSKFERFCCCNFLPNLVRTKCTFAELFLHRIFRLDLEAVCLQWAVAWDVLQYLCCLYFLQKDDVL